MQQRDDGSFVFSPTDLVNFLGCSHSTVLDIRSFSDKAAKDEVSESDKLLRRKGDEHEAAYLASLKEQGKRIAETPKDASPAERFRMTKEAMRKGADVVFQAALLSENWGGYADFLVKIASPSSLGGYSYEPVDTKLARHARAKHIIQLGVYSSLLTILQERLPAQVHLVLGDNSTASFSVNDFISYVHHAMHRLQKFVSSPPPDSYPEPCAHCTSCHWKDNCAAKWKGDDHLSLVANIQRSQAAKLERAGIKTVAQLAALPRNTLIPNLNPQVFDRLRSQAALQLDKRKTNKNTFELLALEVGRGFSRLPRPDAGDLFFDMEGDPLYPQGLEYLFGVSFLKDGALTFLPFWAHSHEEERAAFAKFMAFLKEHLTAHPNAYIYHYNHYETTALKRLACQYAIAEHQLDDLLRRKKFVDLYTVVRGAVRVSEPSYSLKNLEVFYMDERDGNVTTAGDSIVVYNNWRETGEAHLLKEIATYNEVDCVSTAKLRDWLLSLRPSTVAWFDGAAATSGMDAAAEKTSARLEREARYLDFQSKLLISAHSGDCRGPLADLLEFHAREERPQWWEYFDRPSHLEEELLEDSECLAGLRLAGPPQTVKRSLLHTYRFPAQETKRRAGDKVIDVSSLTAAGTIEYIDEDKLLVEIKRGANKGPLPDSLNIGPGGPIRSDALREAIYRYASNILAGGSCYPAIGDILTKSAPRLKSLASGRPITEGDDLLAGTVDAVVDLADSYLFVQGPPGAGKTYTTAHTIVELIRRGKKVGVAANSHNVIHNLLDVIETMAIDRKVTFEGVKKSSAGKPESIYSGTFIGSEEESENISLSASLLAGSAWLFAHERFDQHLDYLFIDEAGQVSVANVIAMGVAARNIVLVGDQMQLGQPIQGVHPGEAGLSILDYLLAKQATVSPERGIFLNHTRRLCPSICQFISDAFYEGRLTPVEDNHRRLLEFKAPIAGISPHGIHFIPISHVGCSQKCEEEAKAIKDYFGQLLGQTFKDKDGTTRLMTVSDILVVTPYNVQVNHLRSVLPGGARVGTVDKFQGQEAPVVLVSMVTSDAECLPRDIEFLFSANRLNVAISRAQCLALVVASPKLLEVPCKSIEHLRLVNKFCQLASYASSRNAFTNAEDTLFHKNRIGFTGR
ncbi:MAG: TM0106 family RecB-like putative nuclease [Planctomycetes bacterium]|nr:TM0106 family RecB-like putative nuclease [Planctomycetota bacterium]